MSVLALPLILCISLWIKFHVYVSSSTVEILQTDKACVTEKISVAEYFSVNPLTLESIKDSYVFGRGISLDILCIVFLLKLCVDSISVHIKKRCLVTRCYLS